MVWIAALSFSDFMNYVPGSVVPLAQNTIVLLYDVHNLVVFFFLDSRHVLFLEGSTEMMTSYSDYRHGIILSDNSFLFKAQFG